MSTVPVPGEAIAELEEQSQVLAESLRSLCAGSDAGTAAASAFRGAHHLGTAAAMLGLERLTTILGRMQPALGAIRGGLAASPVLLDALSAGADAVAEITAALGRGEGEGGVDASGVLEDLDRVTPPTAPVARSRRSRCGRG